MDVDKPIGYSTFQEGLKANLGSIMDDTTMYSTHLFHPGGATVAANSGISDRIIQKHGWWWAPISKDMYISDDISKSLKLSQKLQWTPLWICDFFATV